MPVGVSRLAHQPFPGLLGIVENEGDELDFFILSGPVRTAGAEEPEGARLMPALDKEVEVLELQFAHRMTMINPNVARAISEVLESHEVTVTPGERLSDTVGRELGLNDSETERWLEALNEGCTVEEANRRAGISSHRETEPLLIAVARAVGRAAGKMVK